MHDGLYQIWQSCQSGKDRYLTACRLALFERYIDSHVVHFFGFCVLKYCHLFGTEDTLVVKLLIVGERYTRPTSSKVIGVTITSQVHECFTAELFTSFDSSVKHLYPATTITMGPPPTTAMPRRTHTAFFYGTLMVPSIFFRVTVDNTHPPASHTENYTFTPALLHNYSRRKVLGDDFPGICAQPGSVVIGYVVAGITDRDLRRLDRFEGEGNMYFRECVHVQILQDAVFGEKGEINYAVLESAKERFVAEKGAPLMGVETYVWNQGYAHLKLEQAEWDYEEFRMEKMAAWVGGKDDEFEGEGGASSGSSHASAKASKPYEGFANVREMVEEEVDSEDEETKTERIVSVIAELRAERGREVTENMRLGIELALEEDREKKMKKLDENEKLGSAV